jgi:hypothetical protein
MDTETRPAPPSRSSSGRSSKKSSLTLDLSGIPPIAQPPTPTNTLIFAKLQSPDIFLPDNQQKIRELVELTAPVHSWSPLKSLKRLIVSFADEKAAAAVRDVWDNEEILGSQCRVYFGHHTDIEVRDKHLNLPDAGKLFFISPPPSPPHDWEVRMEDAPNKMVHADDLAEALAKLRHHHNYVVGDAATSPISPVDDSTKALPEGDGGMGRRTRSRSSTLIFQPQPELGNSPDLPCVTVDDMTDEPEEISPAVLLSPITPLEGKTIMAHTARPPVEIMEH